MTKTNRREYTHQPLNDDFTSISGHYTLHKEVRQPYGDRELLYVIGQACMDSACCGTGNWDYGLVPGYVVSWQTRTNDTGLPVTEVEPITDERTKADIERLVKDTESVSRIEFW